MANVQAATSERRRGRPSKGQPKGNLALLHSAQEMFAKEGYAGASLRDISAAANVDPGLASHHFGSKEALWIAVVDRLALPLSELAEQINMLRKRRDKPVRERLEEALRAVVSTFSQEPQLGMFIGRIGTEGGARLELLVTKLVAPLHDSLQPLMKEAMSAKVIQKQPVEVLYFMLMNAIAMTISYRHMLVNYGKSFASEKQLEEAMLQCVVATFAR